MKKLFLIAAIILTLVIILPVIIGAFMAREHSISRSEEFSVPQTVLWTTITDTKDQSWRKGVARIDENDRLWTEMRTNGSKDTYKVVAEDMPNRLIRRQADSAFNGEWEFVLDPTETGSRLTLTERTSIDNPFLRFMNRLFGGRTLEGYLSDLKKRLS